MKSNAVDKYLELPKMSEAEKKRHLHAEAKKLKDFRRTEIYLSGGEFFYADGLDGRNFTAYIFRKSWDVWGKFAI